MQTIGYLVVNGSKIKVLVRPNISGKYVSLKLRQTGDNGKLLQDESAFFERNPDQLLKLLDGQTVKV